MFDARHANQIATPAPLRLRALDAKIPSTSTTATVNKVARVGFFGAAREQQDGHARLGGYMGLHRAMCALMDLRRLLMLRIAQHVQVLLAWSTSAKYLRATFPVVVQ